MQEGQTGTASTLLEIWTDGACKGNPGPGGWGACLIYGKHTLELYDGEPLTTNNRMELSAVIASLASLERPCRIEIHTDSTYVRNGITQWLVGWAAKGWKTAAGKPVKNVDLWKLLHRLSAIHDIRWIWVKGHAGIDGNEKADQLANMGVEVAQGKRPPCPGLAPAVSRLLKGEEESGDATDLPGH